MRYKKRTLAAVGAGLMVSTIGFASASTLGVNAGVIQFGTGEVSCDSDGISTNWGLETDDNTVRSVRFEGIDPSCTGAELFVKIDGSAATYRTVIGGTSASVSFPAPYLNPANINDLSVWIEG